MYYVFDFSKMRHNISLQLIGLCAMVISPQRPPLLGQGFGSCRDGGESDFRACPSPVTYFLRFENQIKKARENWYSLGKLHLFDIVQIQLKQIPNHAILKKKNTEKYTNFCLIFLWSGGPSQFTRHQRHSTNCSEVETQWRRWRWW